MRQLPGDEIAPAIGKAIFTLFIDKGILTCRDTHQLLMSMHAGAAYTLERLRQERGVDAMQRTDSFEDIFGNHQAIGHVQRMIHLEIQVLLASSNLVVTVLDHDLHMLEPA